MMRFVRKERFIMFKRKITRKEFLKSGFIVIAAFLAAPIYRIFNTRRNVSHKEASYYNDLAG